MGSTSDDHIANDSKGIGRSRCRAKLACLVGLAALLVLTGCDSGRSGKADGGRWTSGTVVKSADTSLHQQMKRYRELVRIKPDRRAMDAVALIHAAATGEARADVECRESPDGWTVHYRGREVGALSQYPAFPELMRFTGAWARVVSGGDHAGQDTSSFQDMGRRVDRFFADDMVQLLGDIDKRWQTAPKERRELARLAGQALTNLALQIPDRLETADEIAARALAAVAMGWLDEVPQDGEQRLEQTRLFCRLAWASGYHSDAWLMAETLPASDPVRLFVREENNDLRDAAAMAEATPQTRYLHLITAARGRLSMREEWVARQGDMLRDFPGSVLPVLASALREINFETEEALSALAVEKCLRDMTGGAQGGDSDISLQPDVLRRLDAGSVELKCASEGPFLDRSLLSAYYRAHVYVGLERLGKRSFEGTSDRKRTARFLDNLGPADARAGNDFARWFESLHKAVAGRGEPEGYLADLREIRALGPSALSETVERGRMYYRFLSPESLEVAGLFISRLDTRPRHRGLLADLALSTLGDAALCDRLSASLYDTTVPLKHGARAWYAARTGNERLLGEIVSAPGVSADDCAIILSRNGVKEVLGTEKLERLFSQLHGTSPESFDLTDSYFAFLWRLSRYKDAKAVIVRHLDTEPEEGTFPFIYAYTRLADACLYLGEHDEGMRAADRVIRGNVLTTMRAKAALSELLGRRRDADRYVKAVASMYPDDPRAPLLEMEICWRRGQWDRAAQVLKDWPYPPSSMPWKTRFGPTFRKVFADRPAEDALAAVRGLARAGFDGDLPVLAEYLAAYGHHELAFEITAPLSVPDPSSDVFFASRAYSHIAHLRGQEKAVEWLRGRLSAEALPAFSMPAFSERHYECLWELLPLELPPPDTTYIWLLRAAASLDPAWRPAQAERYTSLLQTHYANPPADHYDVIGRYLLGLVGEDEVLALARNAKGSCEVGFFLGWKAQCELRIEDAAEWYRATVMLNQNRNAEHKWAAEMLGAFVKENMSVDRLKDRVLSGKLHLLDVDWERAE